MRKVLPFILCGGAGTRLWPLSREAFPKQFHRLTGQETLFQETCRRLSGPLFGDLFVLANHRHRFLIAEQLEEIGALAKNIVLEPVSRNTGPSACIAALIAARSDPEALVLLSREDLAPNDYKDPGPYKNPPGTVAYEVNVAQAGEPARSPKAGESPGMEMPGMEMPGMEMPGMNHGRH